MKLHGVPSLAAYVVFFVCPFHFDKFGMGGPSGNKIYAGIAPNFVGILKLGGGETKNILPNGSNIKDSAMLNGNNFGIMADERATSFQNGNIYWCYACKLMYTSMCAVHKLKHIKDKPVLPRAWVTLPKSVLSIKKINLKDKTNDFGVFAKKRIPVGTCFGPLQGVLEDKNLNILPSTTFVYSVITSESEINVDISDEAQSNWMRFVRPAMEYRTQNIFVDQHGSDLYFITSRSVASDTELRIGYSISYALKRKLKLLRGDPGECIIEKYLKDGVLNVHDNYKNIELQEKCENVKLFDNYDELHENEKLRYHCENVELCDDILKYTELLDNHENVKLCDNHDNVQLWNNHKNAESCDNHEYFESGHSCENVELGHNCENTKLNCDGRNEKLYKNQEVCDDSEPQELQDNHENQELCDNHENKEVHGHNVNQEPHVNRNNEELHIAQNGPAKDNRMVYNMAKRQRVGYSLRPRCVRNKKYSDSVSANNLEDCDTAIRSYKTMFNSACCKKKRKDSSHVARRSICVCCEESIKHKYLSHHFEQHRIDGFFHCTHCNKKTENYFHLKKHVRNTHCEYKFICAECSKPFRTRDKLTAHLQTHAKLNRFLCAHCGKLLSRADKLRHHINIQHREGPKNPEITNDQSETMEILRRKRNRRTKSDENQPNYTHSDKITYKCKICHNQFIRKKRYINHMSKFHPELALQIPEYKFICPYCKKEYVKFCAIKQHILKVHPDAKQMQQENNDSISFGDLNISMESIFITAYCCKWCEQQFADKSDLLSHQQNMHKDYLLNEQEMNINETLPICTSSFFLPGIGNGTHLDVGEEIEITLDSESLRTLKESIKDGAAEIIDITRVEDESQ